MASSERPPSDSGTEQRDSQGGQPCTPAFLGSIEDIITTVDGLVCPESTTVDAQPPLGLDEILPPEFISSHTDTGDAREYFAAFGVNDRSDLLALPSGVDVTIDATTEFEDLGDMLRAAVEHRID